VFISRPTSVTAGVSFPWPTTESASNRSTPSKSLACSSACMAATNIPAAASGWPSANVSWSSTADAYGWSDLRPGEDQPSASPFPPARDSEKPAADPAPRTVLLVEDNPTDVYVIKHVLDSCGLDLDIRVARDGQEALLYLGALEENEMLAGPALILLDLNIPNISGIQVLGELRSSKRYSRAPVIIVTSSTAAVDRAAAERLQAEAYFQKPKTLTAYMELADLVKQFLHPAEDKPR
jgi:chemotaxis family two-component system response regulator Rcp1